MKQVIVLGAGYAGLMAAMRLAAETPPQQAAITLVSAHEMFDERVRSHQWAAGQALRRYPLSQLVHGTRIELVQAQVVEVQPAGRQVQVRGEAGAQTLRYDYLVYALGSRVATADVPGVREHAFPLDPDRAAELASRLAPLEHRNGRLLVVGSGNTGVEVASELAESYPALNVTLATRRSFARNLSEGARDHIRKAFARLGITFLEDTDIVTLEAGRALAADGGELPFDVCIWTGGFAVSDLARRAGLRVNERGQILIDRAMRSLSHPEIYAVGDAAYPMEEPGAPVRMSLYTAIMMGAHGADTLAAQLRGEAPSAFGLSYVALGLSLGRRDGVFQLLDGNQDTPLRFILTGRLANRMREFFVAFALWSIRVQRVAPWSFTWPGRGKLRHLRLESRPPLPTPMPAGRSAARGQSS